MATIKKYTIPNIVNSTVTLSILNPQDITLKCVFHETNDIPNSSVELPFWTIDLHYKNQSIEREVKGIKLVESDNILKTTANRFPFEIGVISDNGYDPFLIDDFTTERCFFYFRY